MEESVKRISIRNKKFEGTPLESGDSIDVVVVGVASNIVAKTSSIKL